MTTLTSDVVETYYTYKVDRKKSNAESKAYYAKHKDELNRKKREAYAASSEMREASRAKSSAYRLSKPEKKTPKMFKCDVCGCEVQNMKRHVLSKKHILFEQVESE